MFKNAFLVYSEGIFNAHDSGHLYHSSTLIFYSFFLKTIHRKNCFIITFLKISLNLGKL